MKLKPIFQRKRRVVYEDRNTKGLASWPERFWDFSYASKFLKEHRDDLILFELRMYGDRDVGETFIENGNMIKALNGGDYQQGHSALDGVLYTVADIPAIHVIYKGGAEEWIACYQSTRDDWSYSHRKLTEIDAWEAKGCLVSKDKFIFGQRGTGTSVMERRMMLNSLFEAFHVGYKAGRSNRDPATVFNQYIEQATTHKIQSNPTIEQKEAAIESRWISVKKQFPEVGQRVLGFTGSCSMIASYEGGTNWTTDYHSHMYPVENAFTHWMPLPSAPQEDRK